jgi:glutamate synthase (NADPH) large chain
VKDQLSHRNPYQMWLKENRLLMDDIKVKHRVPSTIDNFETYAKEFGYSKEDMYELIQPMCVSPG